MVPFEVDEQLFLYKQGAGIFVYVYLTVNKG